jgi:TonB-dependent receptor
MSIVVALMSFFMTTMSDLSVLMVDAQVHKYSRGGLLMDNPVKDLISDDARRFLLAGVSAVALFTTGSVANAQDAEQDAQTEDDVEFEEIVVTGIRQSIATAQALKKNSDTFVDAITASDIGALPDRSVSEALQRVPGVNIIRFAGPNDPDHFAVEGSGVVVRGLPFVRSELNGRDVFGANSGGVLGFEDVSPELLGSVRVFKNQSADLVEGGIAGTIDLRTRLPFDQDGQLISFSVEGNYGDLAEELTPSGSILYSNNWETSGGRFGLLANASYTQLKSRAEATQIANFVELNGGGFVPTGGGIRAQDFDRQRESYAVAAQWESPDRSTLATFQFLRSDSTLLWGENVIETQADGSGDANNFDATDFVFDDDGILQSGTITDNSQWRGPNATAALLPSSGGQQTAITRERFEEDITNDFGFNLKYIANDRLRFNFDAQYITSDAQVLDGAVYTSFFSPVQIDRSGGQVPTFSYVPPAGQGSEFFQGLNNHYIRAFADQITDNDAESVAFRGDVEYDFSGDGFIKSVRAGVRYSDQDIDLRESDFNWGNISEVWTGRDIGGNSGGDFNAFESILLLGGNSNPALNAAVDGLFGIVDFPDFQRGSVGDTGLGAGIPGYIGPITEDFDSFAATRDAIIAATGGATGNRSFCGSPYSSLAARVCTNGDSIIPGTPFLNSEIGSVSRETWALYTRFDFGTESIGDSGISLDGNIGLRYVHTDRTITAAQILPSFAGLFPTANQCDPAFIAANPDNDPPGFCNLDLATLQSTFGNGNVEVVPVDTSYSEFLPSLNLKLGITDEHIVRFAVSRTLSRPTVTEINQRPVIGILPDIVSTDANGVEVNSFGGFVGSFSGNAQLLPQTAVSFDLSWEWYFAPTGSLTITAFNKNINNFIANDVANVPGPDGNPILIDGEPIQFNTNNNSDQNAIIRGVEFAYQQFYDFLPDPFDGLGVQFNYTFIDEKGVPFDVDRSLFTGENNPVIPRFENDEGIIPRISEHNINAALLYEKAAWQARIAYNWRSEFQVTPRDVIFPFATIYQPATGQVDFSVFYNIDENWKVGVQGVNILDDVTVTTQSVNEDGLRAPRSFFRNDRRFTFIVRATF